MPGSGSLVLVRPEHRLPQLDLVSVGVDDPSELPILVRLRALQDLDPGSLRPSSSQLQLG